MSKRVSHSVLDPWIGPPIKKLYPCLPIPAGFPPEGIIAFGHLAAILAAFGLANCASYWWGGLLATVGVASNHIADCLDGTHARSTGQCRNGGELLDHFTDPLSFAYWMIGLGVCCGKLELALVAVICIYAMAVLTNIKAKIVGEFQLASFGPSKFKVLLVVFGLVMCSLTAVETTTIFPGKFALWFFCVLIVVGIVQLVWNLVLSVRDVNVADTSPDTSEWHTVRSDRPSDG